MHIQIIEGIEGAQQARDIAVIIDVLRAATVSAYLLHAGVRSITPVATVEEALAHKQQDPDVLLVGEDQGIRIPDFDIGNSPSEILLRKNLTGKRVIHRSSAGTQGLVNAKNAQHVIFGSFVTGQAIIRHLQNFSKRNITLVPMYAPEDQLFAEYLRDSLLGKTTRTEKEVKSALSEHEWLQKSFLDPTNEHFPEADFHLSLQRGIFDFFPVVSEGEIVKSSKMKG